MPLTARDGCIWPGPIRGRHRHNTSGNPLQTKTLAGQCRWTLQCNHRRNQSAGVFSPAPGRRYRHVLSQSHHRHPGSTLGTPARHDAQQRRWPRLRSGRPWLATAISHPWVRGRQLLSLGKKPDPWGNTLGWLAAISSPAAWQTGSGNRCRAHRV